jgi:hypothetical protein
MTERKCQLGQGAESGSLTGQDRTTETGQPGQVSWDRLAGEGNHGMKVMAGKIQQDI